GKDFSGKVLQADGVNMEVYSEPFEGGADVFLALTSSDNTNIMAAEIAKQKFKSGKVIARVDDPIRAKAFEELGIETFCPTVLSEKRIAKMMAPPKQDEDKGE
ncbi:MAG TPA: NAD-binding protein, partial [Candidatus Goldiibacteriota bacterium]|nr:NAD-binding protein [Candidatus Goldiibacteriota bacterium]